MDPPRRRQKTSSACQRCRSRKLGCDRSRPCQQCIRAGVPCIPRGETSASERAVAANANSPASPSLDLTRPRREERAVLPEQSIVEWSKQIVSRDHPAYDTSALPGGEEMSEFDSNYAKSWDDIMGVPLPPPEVLDELVDRFFNSVNWFMMVFHEEHFRRRYENLLTTTQDDGPPENNFLWLVLLVLALGAHYSSLDASGGKDICSDDREFSKILLEKVENKFCRIIGAPNVEAVQVCILLGSFRLFNGRPAAGLGILGSGVKIAQIMGLYRESMWKGVSGINREVRRRTWWALEVFDKYAAIAFGRPCTIDESRCGVEYPVDIRLEGEPASYQEILLEYHLRKFELYRLMGPFLGRRSQTDRLETVNHLHNQLLLWKSRVPHSLRLQTYRESEPSDKPPLYQLQALALQLTYDNLQIILHRSVAFGDTCHGMTESPTNFREQVSSFHREELLQAALRTSELGHYSHVLHTCRRTHAVMHVGICLFTAGVVLCAVCLSDPLSPSSQKAKAGIMSILRLHRNSFSGQHLLSVQSARILEDAVAAVMRHEQELILGTPRPRSVNVQRRTNEGGAIASTSQDASQVSATQDAENEAFLAPLQEVFAHHLQDGALRTEPPTDATTDQVPPNMAGSYEDSPMLGPSRFSWVGDVYSMIDPDFADANQLWLWSDSTLQDFL